MIFENYSNLGFFNPYYIKNNKLRIYNSFKDALTENAKKELDPASFIQIISKGYCFGNRTLIKGLFKSPWMAKPSVDMDKWNYFDLPKHHNFILDEVEIAEKLYLLLEIELFEYCASKQNIGILLSGGMDSRISTGVLNNLVKKAKISPNITALTWGIENSRDVVYAKEIAKRFKWKWEHFELSSTNLLNNIGIVSEIGCEVSPIHLHSMPEVRKFKGLDCIIASSFGDSIGRAVYSSRHISKLSNISKYINNWFFLLKDDFFYTY